MIDLGIVKPGKTIRIPFSSFDKDDGSSITMTNYAVADILIYKDGSTTERASTSGFTATTDFDTKTGKHLCIIDLSDNTTAGFFAAGSEYLVAIDAVTVDTVTTGGWIARFTIGYEQAIINTTIATLASQTSFTLTSGPAEDDALNGMWAIIHDVASAVQLSYVQISDYTGSTKTITLAAGATFTAAATDNISIVGPMPLQPTTTARTLDVSSTGEAGVDWANIGSPTTTVNLSGTTVKTATDVETDTADIQSRLPAALVSGKIDANIGAISDDTTAADNAEAFFDGTGYAGTNNVIPTVTTLTGHTPQTGDSYARIGTPAGASVSADIAAFQSDLDSFFVADGTVAGTPTTTEFDSNLTLGDDIPNDLLLIMTSGTYAKAARPILDYANASGHITLSEALPGAPSASDTFRIIAFHVHPVTQIQSGLATAADLATVDTVVDGIKAVTDNLPDSGALTTISTSVTNIVADTNELQTDLTDGGRLDLILDELTSQGDTNETKIDTIDGIVDAILIDTAEIGSAGAGLASIPYNASWSSSITSACDNSIVNYSLDHLMQVAVSDTDVQDNSVIAKLVSSSATADWSDFVNTTDSLQSIRDRGDAAWTTATSVTVSDKTGFKLASDGMDLVVLPADIITASSIASDASAEIADAVWDELTTGHVVANSFGVLATSMSSTVTNIETKVDTVDSIVDAILVDTTEIGSAGSGLTNVPWNSSWDSEVESECKDALIFYYLDKIMQNVGSVDDNLSDATTTYFKTNLGAAASGYYDDSIVSFITGSLSGQSKPIASYGGSGDTGSISLDEALTAAPSNGDQFVIIRSHVHPISQIQSGLATSSALSTVASNVSTILADTNEIQGDWTNGGRLDLILDELTTQGDTNQSKIDVIDGIVDSILVDTGTTLPAVLGTPTDTDLATDIANLPQDNTGCTLASSEDVYHADVDLSIDDANSQDEYTVVWFKNGVRVSSGITSPLINVIKRSDGTDLIASSAMTQIGSSGAYKYDATSSERSTAGESVVAIISATIDSSTRTWVRVLSRDSA